MSRSRLAALCGALTAVLTASLLVAAPARAESAYPFPLPDFTHPGRPHSPLFHDRGDTLIPLLVLYARFDDLLNLSEAGARDKIFPINKFGTVTDYYLANYIGVLVPVVETYGERDNGVVMVNMGQSAPAIALDPSVRRRKMLELADPYVDFARYDTDRDGDVDDSELAVITIFTSRPGTDGCGQTRGVASGGTLDGKSVAFRTADGGSQTNGLTFAHELAHQTYDIEDHYGWGVGDWDLAGPTCGGGERWQRPGPWLRMHLGGQTPTVVTKDRYVDLSASVIDTSYLLYDPAKGVDDYFLVQAREPRAGTYDQDVPDSGVVIWRVDERQYKAGSETARGVELLRPDGVRTPGCVDEDVDGRQDEDPRDNADNDGDGRVDEDDVENPPVCDGGGDTDAWDPADTRTPQRTMDRPWADGTPAGVAVRAIGRPFYAGSATEWHSQVYLDVRGPGVLVDPAGADGNAPHPTISQGASLPISYTVMNTGEATDTFEFTVLGDTGWTATKQTMTLAPGQRATATINVTAPTGVDYTRNTLTATGRSTSDTDVRTDYRFLVEVPKRRLALTYTGDTAADYSDPATASVTVGDDITGAPVAGVPVTFTFGTQEVTVTSGADGGARVPLTVPSPGSHVIRVATPGDATYAAASRLVPFTSRPEKVTLNVTSQSAQPTGNAALVVTATQEADSTPADLTGVTVTATLTPTLTSTAAGAPVTVTGPLGTPIPIPAGAEVWSVTLALNDGRFTAPPSTTELAVFDPRGRLSGLAIGRDAQGTTVTVQPTGSYLLGRPIGWLTAQIGRKTVTATSIDWTVVRGNRAIIKARGQIDGAPATVRITVTDNGLLPRDVFELNVTGGLTYQERLTATIGGLTVAR
ncbi:hypothetical protein [Herbidospora mongoliensis]|uniref:hypothetical protein n=1 Tax=Herbidospora mongoliensis TaxID=688067 RepID=UPI000834082D|nr:hypothetical protein [Herbidospora mongoliensis]